MSVLSVKEFPLQFGTLKFTLWTHILIYIIRILMHFIVKVKTDFYKVM